MKSLHTLLLLLAAAFILCCVAACANMGSGPDGGPYDETPPRIVGMTPPQSVASGMEKGKKRKSAKTRFQLIFSELVTIDNPSENVIVSPPQQEMPEIDVAGRKITVTLHDSLIPHTTYTVDFADAIRDNNEGNPLGHFTYIFSTAEQTDTMQMGGYVLNAEDLEPISGILVGLHPGAEAVAPQGDTLFTKRPFDRVARTDGNGWFSIKGVDEGRSYNAYALRDADGDFAFSQRSEQIAFSRRLLVPSSFPDVRRDTVWADSVTIDSVRVTPFTHFLPDDVVLLAFQEANQPRSLLKTDRSDIDRFRVFFTAPSKHVPLIEGLNFDARDAFVEQRSLGNDTIVYWLRDSLLMQQDTLSFRYTYMAWDDSLQTHLLRTDTLDLASRIPWEKRVAQWKKDEEKRLKTIERKRKSGETVDDAPPVERLGLKVSVGSTLSPADNILLQFNTPVASIDLAKLHLNLVTEDSVEMPARFELDSLDADILSMRLRAEWRPEQTYHLTIDSAAAQSIYGTVNLRSESNFSVEPLDNFGTLFVTLSGLDSVGVVLPPAEAGLPDSIAATPPSAYDCCRVELLDGSGRLAYAVRAADHRAEFYYLREGEYFLRCIIDRNGNGKWDTGSWADRLPPEDVFYLPESIVVRAGWDVNTDWNVTALPRFRQKPEKLIRQKASKKTQSSAHERNIKRMEERTGRAEKDRKNRAESR